MNKSTLEAMSSTAITVFQTKMRVAEYTDKQLKDEIRLLREILGERQRVRASKRYMKKQYALANTTQNHR